MKKLLLIGTIISMGYGISSANAQISVGIGGPAPVYVAPSPVIVAPAPVVVAPTPYGYYPNHNYDRHRRYDWQYWHHGHGERESHHEDGERESHHEDGEHGDHYRR